MAVKTKQAGILRGKRKLIYLQKFRIINKQIRKWQ